MLSPIGVVSLPPSLVEKRRQGLVLEPEEIELLRRVPQTSSQLLANIPRLQEVARIVLYQRKNFDGSGFPEDDVTGAGIPHESRILRVLIDLADVLDQGRAAAEFFAELPEDFPAYDPAILAVLRRAFAVEKSAGAETAVPPTEVDLPWQELRVGQELRADVRSASGQLVATRGTRITSLLLSKISIVAELEGISSPVRVATAG